MSLSVSLTLLRRNYGVCVMSLFAWCAVSSKHVSVLLNLLNCGAVRALMGQIVRQQDL